jgi:Tfp pilus assembly protein PilV
MSRRGLRAFSLLEVMVACAIFFIALFSILELVTRNLRAARSLKQVGPTIGMAAAQLSQTNRLEEGSLSGDFGELYSEYNWTGDVTLASSNGLYQVDITVFRNSAVDSAMSILLYRPDSPQQPRMPTGVRR